MEQISFFSPVYYVDRELDPSGVNGCWVSEPLTFRQKVINFAEYTLAFGKAYAVESSQINCYPWVATRCNEADQTTTQKWVRGAITTALIASAIICPILFLIPIALLLIKIINFINHPPIEIKLPTGTNGEKLSDAELGKQSFISDLALLKIGGRNYHKLSAEIQKVNSNKNPVKAEIWRSTFLQYQNHCKEILKNPEFSESIEVLRNAIEGLTNLKSSINSIIKGIPNIGNSCYMNAAMQALLAIPLMSERILAIDVNDESKVPHNKKKVTVALQKFIMAYGDLSSSHHKMQPFASALREAFYDAGDIDHSPGKFKLEKNITELLANDGDEAQLKVLRFKLESLINEDLFMQNDAIRVVHSVLDLLGFGVRTLEVKTPKEEHLAALRIKSMPSTFLLLPMELVLAQKKFHLSDFIDNYFSAAESGDEINYLAVPDARIGGSGRSFSWNEQIFIEGPPPPFIALQLNRLVHEKVDGEYTGEQILSRASVQFDPDEKFDLSKYFDTVPEGAEYRVSAVIRQSGFSGPSGHYTSVKRDAHNFKIWNFCDDSSTSSIQGSSLKAQLSQGYIFFLEKIDSVVEDKEDSTAVV
ncbi:MAG: hypothetical protein H0W50_01270 [Parachlamydiaceae bacterium]|nr:hypothetical protein [Parachlamydiaceae bacterium]